MTIYQTPLERQQMIERIRDRERLSSALGGARVMNIAPSTRDVDEAQLSSLPYLRQSPPIAGGTGSLYGTPASQEEINRMQSRMGGLGSIGGMMTAGLEPVKAPLQRGKGAFGALNPLGAIASRAGLFGGGGNKKFVGFEKGGTVSSGRPYMVGEKGAELFVPSRTGTIVPNNQLGMAGGGVPVNITYQIQSFDSKDTLQAITENAPAISGIIEQQFNRRGKRGFTV